MPKRTGLSASTVESRTMLVWLRCENGLLWLEWRRLSVEKVPLRRAFTWERAPWSRCARCEEHTLGFLSGGDHSIVWRCSRCQYRVVEPLAQVDKKVIYIDQFVFSELFKLKARSEEHTSELQSLMRISYAVFCLKKKKKQKMHN